MAKWYNVNDKTHRPKDGEAVLCYCDGHYFEAVYEKAQENKGCPFGWHEMVITPQTFEIVEGDFQESFATHWTKLPKAPEFDEGVDAE